MHKEACSQPSRQPSHPSATPAYQEYGGWAWWCWAREQQCNAEVRLVVHLRELGWDVAARGGCWGGGGGGAGFCQLALLAVLAFGFGRLYPAGVLLGQQALSQSIS